MCRTCGCPCPQDPGMCKRKERRQRRKETSGAEMTAVLMAVELLTVALEGSETISFHLFCEEPQTKWRRLF